MGLSQFANSIKGIVSAGHINSVWGVYRHLLWQIRKAFNIFPCELSISKSRILAKHRKCGVSALINSRGMFDYNNMNLIKWLLKEGGIFFDIGANIGAYTLVASEQALARVYAFEPHPATFKLLTENIAINGRDNIKALNLALGNQEGTVDFLGEYGSPLNRVVADGHILQNTIKVPMRRAADICRDYNVSPDFVKVDVEGFEYEVLKGFDEYLRVIKLLFIEANEDPDSEESHSIARLLSDNGLKGPYFFDFNNLTFYNDRHGTKEDAVFISIHHLDTLGQNAFSIQSI